MQININLLPEKVKKRSLLLRGAIAIVIVSTIFGAVLFFMSVSLNKEAIQLENQQVKLQEKQQELEIQTTLTEKEEAKRKLLETIEWAESYQYFTTPLIKDLVEQLPERGFFRNFEFNAPHQAVLVVQFDRYSEATHYLTRMKSSPFVEVASIETLEVETLEDELEYSSILPRYLATYLIEFVDERTINDVEEEPLDDLGIEVERND